MRGAFTKLPHVAVLACVSAVGSLQVSAADDADSQRVTANARSDAPSKADSAETAFKKLDRSAKGYVSLEDVAVLPGFATAFVNADSSHLGRLNPTAFAQAWAAYVQGKN